MIVDLRKRSTYDIKVMAVYGRYDVASDVITVETIPENFFLGTFSFLKGFGFFFKLRDNLCVEPNDTTFITLYL